MNETERRKAWMTDVLRVHPEWTQVERERAFFLMPQRGTYQMEVYVAYIMNPASPPFPRGARWLNGELNFDDEVLRSVRTISPDECSQLQRETIKEAGQRAYADFTAGYELIDNPYSCCTKQLNVRAYIEWGRVFRLLLRQRNNGVDIDIPF